MRQSFSRLLLQKLYFSVMYIFISHETAKHTTTNNNKSPTVKIKKTTLKNLLTHAT